jgi:hypothetical protein
MCRNSENISSKIELVVFIGQGLNAVSRENSTRCESVETPHTQGW